jgi:hypothetical protein
MKKSTFLLFTVLLLFSCNSAEDNIKNANADKSTEKNLEGRWLWVSSTGGFAGITQTASDQKKEIEFSGSTLKTYIDGKLSHEQQFFIKTKPSIFGGNKDMIIIDKGLSITQDYYFDRSFEIKDGNLILSEECYDCFISKYERVK